MEVKDGYTNGTFSWVDLATRDFETCKHFYGQLLSWDYEDLDVDGGIYSIARYRGQKVAALFPLSEKKLNDEIPSHWSSYITVGSVDDTQSLWANEGGTVLASAFNVGNGAGRMAVLKDPSGAIVKLWEPKEVFGAELVNDLNALCWNELYSKNLDKSRDFYQKVFGWDYEHEPDSDYVMISNRGNMNGGMLDMNGNAPDYIPPHWMVYFTVDRIEDSGDLAEKFGGVSLTEVVPVGAGKFCVFQDPSGAVFSLIERPVLDS